MFDNIMKFFKKANKREAIAASSKETAKEKLQLVLMQDRANVSADFLDLMKQEIIEVIKKYVVVDEKEIDVRLTNQANDDGTNGAPALYANIPIVNIKNDVKGEKMREQEAENEEKEEEKKDAPKKRGRKPKKVVEAEKEKNEEQEENTDEDTELDEEVEIKDVDEEDSDEVENEDEDTEKEE